MTTFLQLFLFIDIFVAGMALGVAIHYAYTHLWQPRNAATHDATPFPTRKDYLPAAVKERLLQESQVRFQSAVNNSGAQLERDLETTAGLLDKLVKRLGAEIVSDELERYRTELAGLRKQAQADMHGIGQEVIKYQAELEAQATKEIAAEKQRLLQQINTKLADAVGSFLLETLQHNIDLGAQEAYLISMLEEHKPEFVKGVVDEPTAAK